MITIKIKNNEELVETGILEEKKDLEILKSEIKQINDGKIKPKPARLLLDEL